MKAQTLYDLRDEYEYCSGMDLHHFFDSQGLGMSPSGKQQVDSAAAKEFMVAGVEKQYHPGNSVGGDEWRDAALSAINAVI